jgi:hypothetical protein
MPKATSIVVVRGLPRSCNPSRGGEADLLMLAGAHLGATLSDGGRLRPSGQVKATSDPFDGAGPSIGDDTDECIALAHTERIGARRRDLYGKPSGGWLLPTRAHARAGSGATCGYAGRKSSAGPLTPTQPLRAAPQQPRAFRRRSGVVPHDAQVADHVGRPSTKPRCSWQAATGFPPDPTASCRRRVA